jgi:hypothetical protein
VQDRSSWVPAGHVDVTTPNAARIYDYFLGGAHNFAVDREFADRVAKFVPNFDQCRFNRAFLQRGVRFCIDAGIRQFLDLGSGIPTVGNVHEVAQRADPDCRVVYVDNEPIAVAHSEQLLEDNDRATIVQADVRDTETVLGAPETLRMLDFDKPLAVLMVAVMHFIPDTDDPPAIIRRYREAMAPGSYLVFGHMTSDRMPPAMFRFFEMSKEMATPFIPRTREQVTEMLSGFELVEPGVVLTPEWRGEPPEDLHEHPERSANYAAVGLKV